MSRYNPVGLLLISSGSRGDKLLFRYPCDTELYKVSTVNDPIKNPYALRISEDYMTKRSYQKSICLTDIRRLHDKKLLVAGFELNEDPIKNPYALRISEDYMTKRRTSQASYIENGVLVGFDNRILANLLAVKSDLCGKEFEVKINDVVFVGYPQHLLPGSIQLKPSSARQSTLLSFHVVFVLQASTDRYAVRCFQCLAWQLAVALHHEEKRCGYLTAQKDEMSVILDDVASCPEDSRESPWLLMIQKCSLAKTLKSVYDSVCQNGLVEVHVNQRVRVSWCLPHKVNYGTPLNHYATFTPETIRRCTTGLRPYHGILLLVSEEELLQSLPVDASPALQRLIHVLSPLKNLHQLAADATLALSQIFKLAVHLVSWGKAMIIYPLCEKNVYTLAPNADTSLNSSLEEDFEQEFPSSSEGRGSAALFSVLSEFSLPTPLGQHRTSLLAGAQHQARQVHMVVWLLRHQLLLQHHTYVYLLTPASTATASIQHLLRHQRSVTSSSSQQGLVVTSEEETPQARSRECTPTADDTTPVFSEDLAADNTVLPADSSKPALEEEAACAEMTSAFRDSLAHIPAASHPPDLHCFLSLCPYFNGKHHIEDIMYYENMKRSQLLMILDKFRDVLVTCQHEDPNITAWTMSDNSIT